MYAFDDGRDLRQGRQAVSGRHPNRDKRACVGEARADPRNGAFVTVPAVAEIPHVAPHGVALADLETLDVPRPLRSAHDGLVSVGRDDGAVRVRQDEALAVDDDAQEQGAFGVRVASIHPQGRGRLRDAVRHYLGPPGPLRLAGQDAPGHAALVGDQDGRDARQAPALGQEGRRAARVGERGRDDGGRD